VRSPKPTQDPHARDGGVYVALGANLGDRGGTIDRALRALDDTKGLRVLAVSPLEQTAPVGPADQPDFLNGACELACSLDAAELLGRLLAIEADLGRDRSRTPRWGPRVIDLDLLVFGRAQIDAPGLTVPHPRMFDRLFVLGPLARLAPHLRPPGWDRTVSERASELAASVETA